MVSRLLKVKLPQRCLIVNCSSKKKTHYDALGLTSSATHNEIKGAYYKLSLRYHPDKDSSVGAKERFQEISNAYEVLGNHSSRKQYDLRMRTVEGSSFNPQENRYASYRRTDTYMHHSKIYDFDEWHSQHYENVLDRTRMRRQRYEEFAENKQEYSGHSENSSSLIIFTLSVVLTMVFHMMHHDTYDNPVVHDQSRSNSKKP